VILKLNITLGLYGYWFLSLSRGAGVLNIGAIDALGGGRKKVKFQSEKCKIVEFGSNWSYCYWQCYKEIIFEIAW